MLFVGDTEGTRGKETTSADWRYTAARLGLWQPSSSEWPQFHNART